MTAPPACAEKSAPRISGTTRWAAVAVACGALVVWARPSATATARIAQAETFGEYLALRARPVDAARAAAEDDPVRPLLAARVFGGRGARLLFAEVVDEAVPLDLRAGPLPRALAAALAETEDEEARDAEAAAVAVIGCDEAALAPGFEAALATALGSSVSDSEVLCGAARGQSPLGHSGLFEHARFRRVGVVVSVWNLANDLGDTDLLRRLHTRLAPGGPIDELVAALRDPARAAAAQEAWFAARDDAARAVVAVLTGVGFELERRARLHGARAVVVLLGADGGGAALPCTEQMARDVERGLAERGLRVVALPGGLLDASGRLTAAGVEQVAAGVRAALE